MATQLAYYFEHAGILTAAAHCCALAGEKASQRFANAEAFGQFRRGIELLNSGPASKERDAIELRLQVGLALPVTVLRDLSRTRLQRFFREPSS